MRNPLGITSGAFSTPSDLGWSSLERRATCQMDCTAAYSLFVVTKLKRLLPTFFEGIPREEIDHMMAIRRMEKEYEDHETYSDDNVLEVDYSPDHVLERNYQPSEVVPGLNVPGNLQPVDHQTADTLNLDLSTAKSARYDTTTIREMLDSLRT